MKLITHIGLLAIKKKKKEKNPGKHILDSILQLQSFDMILVTNLIKKKLQTK